MIDISNLPQYIIDTQTKDIFKIYNKNNDFEYEYRDNQHLEYINGEITTDYSWIRYISNDTCKYYEESTEEDFKNQEIQVIKKTINSLISDLLDTTKQMDILKRKYYTKSQESELKENSIKFEAYEKSYDVLLDLLNKYEINYKGVDYNE